MKDTEIRLRLSQGEDSATQFKRGSIGVAKLAAELVAFTNAAGGVIFFGVDDDGTICGLTKADAKSLDGEISNAANENVRPAVYPRTEFHTIDDKLILAVIVPEGVSKPYADKTGAFWVKSGPDKRRVTAREELQRMLQASLLIHADELPMAGSSAKDIDIHHFGEFLERNYRIPLSDVLEPGKVDIPQMLSNLGFAAGAQLTLAGVMLFAKTPQRFAPVKVVKCVAFVGNSIAGTRYRDSEDFHGTLRDMYRATMSFVLRNLRHEQRGQGFNSIGIPIVPEDSVSELVANMFLHRDYFVSAPWRVLMFDDRMEIHSPGCLPNHQDIAKIKAGVSVARNPIIFTFATKEIPYRGIGSGIKRAIELYPHIEFVNNVDANEFVAIIRYEAALADGGGVNTSCDAKNTPREVKTSVSVELQESSQKSSQESVLKEEKPQKSSQKGSQGSALKSSQKILNLFLANPMLTTQAVAVSLGVSRRAVAKSIAGLQSSGRLRRVGPDKGGYWEVLEDGK